MHVHLHDGCNVRSRTCSLSHGCTYNGVRRPTTRKVVRHHLHVIEVCGIRSLKIACVFTSQVTLKATGHFNLGTVSLRQRILGKIHHRHNPLLNDMDLFSTEDNFSFPCYRRHYFHSVKMSHCRVMVFTVVIFSRSLLKIKTDFIVQNRSC